MDSNKSRLPPNPKETASFLSILTFFWTVPVFKKGSQKELEIEDLYDTLARDRSEKVGDTLERHYLKDASRCAAWQQKKGTRDKRPQPSLRLALIKTFWKELSLYGVICFVNEVFIRLLVPIMLGNLLRYFKPGSTMDFSQALWSAGGLVGLSAVGVLCYNHYLVGTFNLGMRIRVAVCSLIYRKSLKLSRTALGETAPAKIVNLLSNDVNRFDIATYFVHYLWVSLVAAIVALYFLWIEVGPSGLFGVIVIFIVMPIQAYTGKLSARFRLNTAMKTDERVRLMGEIISGVQVIKMYAWEKPFQALVSLARRLEIKEIRKTSYVRGVYMSFLLITTKIAMFFVMLSMVLFGQEINSEKIFVTVTYLNILANTMSAVFVRAIAEVAESYVALDRLQMFLEQEEFVENIDKTKENGKSAIKMTEIQVECENSHITLDQVVAKWVVEGQDPTLDINCLRIRKGSLVGVIGPVGSGKSSLVQAMLGELPLTCGRLCVNGSVSYASQEPWIFGASIRQNILLGLPYDKNRYDDVVRACALERDFEEFPHGDQTLVGERGASLSGGQKARVNLARAAYRQTDVYLLDEPLAAVDAHVGRHLFQEAVLGFLRGKTRVLVTHQLHYLKEADYIVLLRHGKIEMQGSFSELTASTLEYARLLQPAPEEDADGERKSECRERKSECRERDGDSVSMAGEARKPRRHSSLTQRTRVSESISSSTVDLAGDLVAQDDEEETKEHKVQVAEAEASSKNVVHGSLGMQYFRAGASPWILLLLALAFLVTQTIVSATDFWMSYWTSQEELRTFYTESSNFPETSRLSNTSSCVEETTTELNCSLVHPGFDAAALQHNATSLLGSLYATETCMWTHATLATILLFLTFFRSFSYYNVCMAASQKLHDLMFRGLIRSPMLFFNTNPFGRIMNRFAKDMGCVDELLPKAILDSSQVLLSMLGSILLVAYVLPYVLLPMSLLGILFMGLRRYYLKTSKNIKRLEGIARSPVFTHLNATLQGLSTIRAFGIQNILTAEFDNYQDVHTSTHSLFLAITSAFCFVLDILCLILMAFISFSFLFMSDVLGDRVGLAITQSLYITQMIQWGVRQSAEVANQFMAVERVLEYKLLPPENGIAPDDEDKKSKSSKNAKPLMQPPKGWPSEGLVEFRDLNMRYSPTGPLVLRGLNCVIQSREKIGIVGRTGAGKSSLISALFRLAFSEGSVIIDGVDTVSISLEDLRKKISIIPQDPVLFSGTLRRNLDPFEEYSDAALWQALDEVELKEALMDPAGLQSRVLEEGSNFSVGQRQLVCLARAILRGNRLLMLDEATANVDPHTDNLIQKTIREKFVNCTVLTVAHRLNTIMDSDKVLVMDHGQMVEFDHPYLLLQNRKSLLSRMTADMGKQTAQQLKGVARATYKLKHSI